MLNKFVTQCFTLHNAFQSCRTKYVVILQAVKGIEVFTISTLIIDPYY